MIFFNIQVLFNKQVQQVINWRVTVQMKWSGITFFLNGFFFCGLVRDRERCCNVVGRPGDGLQINENGGKTLDT